MCDLNETTSMSMWFARYRARTTHINVNELIVLLLD